ncbi:MAG: hypothetical protein HF978_03525 [Desulfobacteraceae bacterium]|nr:hypothetical protein [Desulfobacteraceae bacterium]MBC2754596.1 hypothetical protein [Desulfobacteraceae bacterium]
MGTLFKKSNRLMFCLTLFALTIGGGLILLMGCTGSGGGGDDVEIDEPFFGGSGTGANEISIFWQYYGEIGGGNSVQETRDGGYIIAGNQGTDYNFQTHDFFMAKTDAQGNLQWQRKFGGQEEQIANDVKECEDGGYIAVGHNDAGSSRNVYVIKTDSLGNLEWSKTYDAQKDYDYGYAVCLLADGYAVAGSGRHTDEWGGMQEDVWFFKIDHNGNKIAESDRFYATEFQGWNRGYAMTQTTDGGFIIVGYGTPNAVFLVRIDTNGDEIWSNIYGTGIAYSICQTPDNGFIVTGSTTPFDSSESDLLIIKVDAGGIEQWRKIFGGTDMDIGHEVTVTSDGGYLVAGVTRSFGQSAMEYVRDDVYLIKLDFDGDKVWEKVKGMSPDNSESAYAAKEASDGGYVVTGSSQSQVMLAKFDNNGDTILLGELDFTFTVPDTMGLINLSNASIIAETAFSSVTLPQEVGSFVLNRLVDTLNGIPVADLCDNGGSYTWNPMPVDLLTIDSTYELLFSGCTSGEASDDQVIFNGSLFFEVDSLTGDLTGSDYDITMVISPLDVMISDDVGDTAITGGMSFSQILSSGNFIQRSYNDGNNLVLTEDGVPLNISQFDISSIVSSGGSVFSIGNAGQQVIVTPDYLSSALAVTIQSAIQGKGMDYTDEGALLVEAQDGSSLKLVIDNDDVTLEIDTNGDGVTDGTLSMLRDDLM